MPVKLEANIPVVINTEGVKSIDMIALSSELNHIILQYDTLYNNADSSPCIDRINEV